MKGKTLSSKELTEEIERLKGVTAEITKGVFQRIHERIDNRMKETQSLQSEVERLDATDQDYTDSLLGLQEKIGGLEGVVDKHTRDLFHIDEVRKEANEDSGLQWNDITKLQEKVERLEKEKQAHYEAHKNLGIGKMAASLNHRLTALESPNQSDCPLGYKCKEGKGHWYIPTEKSFEECGNTCPRKSEERAETIRRARESLCTLRYKQTGSCEADRHAEAILEALDIAEGK